MSELRLRLLGTPQVALDGAPVTIQRRRALALLAFLAVTGRPHRREVLATLLAGDAADAQAHKHLSNALADLRAALGDYLLVERQTVAFDCTRPYWLDVATFRNLLAAGIPAGDVRPVQQAIELYQDELLAGLCLPDAPAFDEWLTLQREQLGQLLVRGLQTVIELHSRAGTAAEGIEAAQRLLAEDPWREEAHRQLMALLAASGQRSAALAQYETCRRVLAEELGVEPAAETTALYLRLRSEPTTAPHNLPPPAAPLVGREEELGLLAEGLADPACRILSVVGLGGCGKSHLTLEAARRAAAPPGPGADVPFPDGVFLVPFADLDGAAEQLAPTEAEARQRLAGAIGDALGLPATSGAPAGAQAAMLAALRPKALLLVLDDLDHLAAATGLLRDIVRQAPRVKLLLTSRRRLALLEQTVLELSGLAVPSGPQDVSTAPASVLFLQEARRVRANAPLSDADAPHVARLCRLVDGLPLALILAAGWLRAMPCARVAAEVARDLDVLTVTAHDLPPRHRSMRVVLQTSWERLSGAEQGALRRLAVFRGPFDWEAAVAVTGATPEQLLALVDCGLIASGSDGWSALVDLVRHFAAEQLAGQPEEAAETAARHAAYFGAFVAERTEDLRRGRRAQEELATRLADVRAAWDWAAGAAEPLLFERLRAGLSLYFDLTGDDAAGAALFGAAAEALRAPSGSAGDARGVLLGLALAQQGRCLVRQQDYARATEVLHEAAGLAAATGSVQLAVLATRVQGELLFEQGLLAEAGAAFERAAAQEQAGGLPAPDPGARCALGAVALELGQLDRAKEEGRAAQAQARARHDRLAESEALALLAAVDARRGDFAAAESGLERARIICQGLGAPLREARIVSQLGGVLSAGPRRFGAAGHHFATALELAGPAGESFASAVLLPGMGRSARLRGDLDVATGLTRQALAACRELGRRAGEGGALRELGMLSHYRDDDRQALRLGQEALQIAEETGSHWARRDALMLVGHAAIGVGKTAAAAEAYEQALALDHAAGVLQQEIEAVAGCARVAMAQGDLVHAASAAATVLDFLAATPADGAEEPVRLYLTCARILEALGDHRAPGLLGAAYSMLEEQAAGLGAVEREALLQRLPAHRTVAAAWQAQQDADDVLLGVSEQHLSTA